MANDKDTKGKANLDKPPAAPPEYNVRPGLSSMVASRDAQQNGPGGAGSMPGMGGANAIGERAMAVENALGSLAQVMHDPAPISDIIARLRAAVVTELQSSGSPPQPSPNLGGIVAPPSPISPPAMGGMGMPAPPPM